MTGGAVTDIFSDGDKIYIYSTILQCWAPTSGWVVRLRGRIRVTGGAEELWEGISGEVSRLPCLLALLSLRLHTQTGKH